MVVHDGFATGKVMTGSTITLSPPSPRIFFVNPICGGSVQNSFPHMCCRPLFATRQASVLKARERERVLRGKQVYRYSGPPLFWGWVLSWEGYGRGRERAYSHCVSGVM